MRHYRIDVGGKTFELDVRELASDRFEVTLDGQQHDVIVAHDVEVASSAPIAPLPIAIAPNATTNELTAPLPGVIISIDVAAGARVDRGDPLLTIESMKMRNAIRAPRSGVVAEILVSAGQQIDHGQVLLRFEE